MKIVALLIALLVTSNSAYAQQWVCTGNGSNKVCRMVQGSMPTYSNYKYSTPTYTYEPYVVVNSKPVVVKNIETKKIEVKAVEVKPFIVAPVVEVESTTMSTRLILK